MNDEQVRQAQLAQLMTAMKPVPSHVPAQPQTQMRAPTLNERMRDTVRRVYESAAEQPLARIADAIGLSDIQGVAEEMGQPNTGLKLGMMPDGPGGKLVKAPIKAFHGSPHDFDQFSLSKIGTGEGAQAYGHGLYFAEDQKVAKTYRDQLSNSARHAAPFHIDQVRGLVKSGLSVDDARKHVIRNLEGQLDEVSPETVVALKRQITELKAWPSDAFTQDPGRMYEVSIHADPEDFLDWDAPLSQQSEKVRQALGPVLKPTRNERYLMREGDWAPEREQITGAQAYEHLVHERPRYADADTTKPIASKMLKERGIPGIKYLDGASRSAGQGSRNYVVFDDKLISIVKKYGIAGALSAGLINQAEAQAFAERDAQVQKLK